MLSTLLLVIGTFEYGSCILWPKGVVHFAINTKDYGKFHFTALRLGINRPTKRGREKSPSAGHCQCVKEMDDHILAC
jgi:hypothetical protein